MTLFGRSATVFAEYFRNGFGTGAGVAAADLPADLEGRLIRGQIFTTRRDLLLAGMILEAHPLVRISPTLIVGADDGGLLLLLAAEWSARENLVLAAGVQAALGPKASGFGGTSLSGDAVAPVLAPLTRIYLQLRRHF